MCGGFLGEATDVAAPIIGGTIGGIVGGPWGAAAGAAGGEALVGGTPKEDLLAGATAGVGSSVDVGNAIGLDNSISGSLSDAATGALGGVSDSLGLSTPSADTAITDNAAGAGVNSNGTTVTAPSTSTSVTPSGGSVIGAGQSIDAGANQIGTQLDTGGDVAGTATSGSPDLGNVGGSTSVPSNSVGQEFSGTSVPGESGTSLGQTASGAIGGESTDTLGASNPNASLQNQFANAQTAVAQSGGAYQEGIFGPSGGTGTGPIGGVSSSGAAAPAASGATSGLLGKVENAGINAALPLGALAYEAIKGPSQLPGSATALEAGGAATAPLLALENQGSTEAQTGQLTSAQQATITQGVQQQQNQLIQQLASQGVTNPTSDSRYIAGMQQIQQWAQAQQQQYITAAINEATSAGGAASANISQAANDQIQSDTAYQNALAAAFGALGGSIGGVNVNTKQAS